MKPTGRIMRPDHMNPVSVEVLSSPFSLELFQGFDDCSLCRNSEIEWKVIYTMNDKVPYFKYQRCFCGDCVKSKEDAIDKMNLVLSFYLL